MRPQGLNGERVRSHLVGLVSVWLEHGGKRSDLLAELGPLERTEYRVLTSWFSGFLRGYRVWDEWIRLYCVKPPRRKIRALLLASIAVVWNAREESRPIQVNEWVRLARTILSKAEAGLVNAVLRRVLREGEDLLRRWRELEQTWGLAWSHPDWLVQRWLSEFGKEATVRLLTWNQQISPVYLRWIADEPVPVELLPSPWAGFYELHGDVGVWKEWLESGMAYIQDPATRLAVSLLDSAAEHIRLPKDASLMEWCASPGGKSLLLAEARRKGNGILRNVSTHLAVDLPGAKLDLLQKNLLRYQAGQTVRCLGQDVTGLTQETLRSHGLPVSWDMVFVDAPCSNTGVMARKPEVRYRLSPENMRELAILQEQMLVAAAGWVNSGGLLLYSTCSIEQEENEQRVAEFLDKHRQWRQVEGMRWFPHETGHDGGGAFLLRKSE